MSRRKPVAHHPNTIPAAAKEVPMSEQALRRAVDRREVETVTVSGLRRVPPHEIERLRILFGKAST
jgi:hypothetical protein